MDSDCFVSSSVPLSAPKNLRVSEEWYNRFRISWDVPPSPTMGYRVVYQPLSGRFCSEVADTVQTWVLTHPVSLQLLDRLWKPLWGRM